MLPTKILKHTPYISFKVNRPIYPFTQSKVIFNDDINLSKVALFLDKSQSESKPVKSFQKDEVHPIGVIYDIHNEQALNRVELKECFSTAHRSRSYEPLRQSKINSPLDYYRLFNGTLTLCDPIIPSLHNDRSFIHILNTLFHTPYRHLIGQFYHPNCFANYELFLTFIGNLLKNDSTTHPLMYLNEKEGLDFIINHVAQLERSSDSKSLTQPSNSTSVTQIPQIDNKYPPHISDIISKEQAKLNQLEPHHSEYHLTKQYLSILKSIPFTNFTQTPIKLKKIKSSLNTHYGLSTVKKQILNYASLLKYTSNKSNILLLVGPPGTGKTSIVTSISKALNRPLFRIPLGGLHDASELKGHRRTYIGSMPGKLVNSLIRSKCMDPVILLDEIDKLGSHFNNMNTSSVLLEALDPEQHSEFMDHYIDAPIDLSHCMFIATANTTDTIPTPLLDRCTVIEISGYTINDKIKMTKELLISKINKQYRLEITMPDSVIELLIKEYCREAGVRQLWKSLEKIGQEYIREVTLSKEESESSTTAPASSSIVVPPSLSPPKLTLPVEYPPITIDESLLAKYLGIPKYNEQRYEYLVPGVVMGLAWTSLGGSTLYIESIMEPMSSSHKNGGLQITGHLKQVMKESASIAYTYAKHVLRKYPENEIFKNKIHLHVPEGGTPKDGPSAGITMCTSILSLVLNKSIPVDYAMTGELTLSGKVLRIGGLLEKVISAKRQLVKNVIFPRDNMAEWMDIEKGIREGMVGIPVDYYSDVISILFPQLNKHEMVHQDIKQLNK
eukprot:NODE_503_length_7543_cov_0.274046.p1 type:complete len:784 gc:universal NODE_503_length_7543_cov_0.274046:3550-5901(+)